MQPQDHFAGAFAATAARLAALANDLRDVADVDVEATATYWRLVLAPKAAGACPIDIVVDPATQTFDLQIGPETYEQVLIERPGDLEDLITAVVEGRASRRTGASAAGGAALWAETIVRQGVDRVWRRRRLSRAGDRLGDVSIVEREQTWLAYRR